MKIYQKPFLTSYSSEDVMDQIGPLQANSVEFEIWRTGQLNQSQIIKTVKCPDTDVISEIESKTV